MGAVDCLAWLKNRLRLKKGDRPRRGKTLSVPALQLMLLQGAQDGLAGDHQPDEPELPGPAPEE